MISRFPFLGLLMAMLTAGAAGWTTGFVFRPAASPAIAKTGTPAELSSVNSISTMPLASDPLPAATIRTVEEFDRYLKRLKKAGLHKEFAEWLALSVASAQDFQLALEFALAQNLLPTWAAIGAGLHPRETFAKLRELSSADTPGADVAHTPAAARNIFFAALGETDPALALTLLGELPAREAVYPSAGLFQSWAALAPLEAAQQARTLPDRTVRDMALWAALDTWGNADREGMMLWAERQDREVLKTAFRSLYEQDGIRQPAEALALAARYPDLSSHLSQTIAEALARDGVDGWKHIANLAAGRLRNDFISAFGNEYAQQDPEQAWALAQTLSPEEREKFLRNSMSSYATKLPEKVADYLVNEPGQMYLAERFLSAWSKTDPKSALSWAAQNVKGNLLAEKTGVILAALLEKSPPDALKAWATLPAGLQAKSLPDLAKKWGALDPRKALAWTAGLSPSEQHRALEKIFGGWSERDPSAAAEAILAQPVAKMDSTVETIAANLTKKSVSEAEAWTARLPAPQAAAAEKLDLMKRGDLRDRSVVGFVWATGRHDPDGAAAWAGSIDSPEQRKRAFRNLAYNWRDLNRTAARAFASTIPEPDLRKDILRIVNQID